METEQSIREMLKIFQDNLNAFEIVGEEPEVRIIKAQIGVFKWVLQEV